MAGFTAFTRRRSEAPQARGGELPESLRHQLPMRFEAVLAPGQSVVLSTPREVGVAAYAVEISRRGDQVQLHEVAVTN